MKPIYKKVKCLHPFCPQCGEAMRGNNSIVMPWRCSCGAWKYENEYREFVIQGEAVTISFPENNDKKIT